MKKTIIAMLSIMLMLLAFTSCSNNPSPSIDSDTAVTIAKEIDPVELINEVLTSGTTDTVTVTYDTPRSASSMRATATFKGYETSSGAIILSGSLSFTFTGDLTNNTFKATTYEVDSSSLRVQGSNGDETDLVITIPETTSTTTVFEATVSGTTVTVSSATLSIPDDATVTVGGEDVINDIDTKPETPDDNDPVTPSRQYITNANIAEVAASGSGTYYLSENITLTEQLDITASITIDGDGHTISRDTSVLTDETKTINAVILVASNNVILRNLTVDGKQDDSSADWVDGVWGIKVFNATGVELENITVSNINAGIQVNSSTVTVSGAIKFNNAIWGGIGVDKGSSLSNGGALTIARGTTFTTNIERKPIVYIEANSDGSVTDASSILTQVGTNCGSNGGQTWYTNSDIAGRMITEASGFEDLTSDATYYLAANLGTLNSQITISTPIKLDGNGLTITRSTPTPTEGSPENWGTKAIVLINSDGVSISNLTVSGTTETAPSEWNDGEWGIKVYDAKGVTLSNITVQNVNAGIQVNSSAVTVSDAIEFDNTWFGGIGVDKGSTLDNYGTLNVANGTTFTMDITYKPTIYTETDDNAVEGAEATGLTAYRPTIAEKTNQKWYLSAAQYSELKDSVTAISADSTTSATE